MAQNVEQTAAEHAFAQGSLPFEEIADRFFTNNTERIVENYYNIVSGGLSAEPYDTGQLSDDQIIGSARDYFIENTLCIYNKHYGINDVSAKLLAELCFLTEYQISNFMRYKEQAGGFLSGYELSMVNGFHSSLAYFISLLFVFPGGNNMEYLPDGQRGTREAKRFGLDLNNIYSPDKYYRLRSTVEVGLRDQQYLKAGFFAENDAGEGRLAFKNEGENLACRVPVFDFTSFYLLFNGCRIIKNAKLNILAGDFKADFGQGLVIKNGYGFNNMQQPFSFIRNRNRISPYTSTDENDFMRGASATLALPNSGMEISVFVSCKNIDASVKDSCYTSIVTDGIHNTPQLLAKRKTMTERIAGANVTKEWKKLKAGITAVAYGYNRYNAVKETYYNKYQLFTGTHFNVGVNWLASLNRFFIFGEAAFDNNAFAAIAGAYYRSRENFEIMFSAREYQARYIAPYSGPYSTISKTYNQRGAVLLCSKQLSNGVQLSLFADGTYYPCSRYRIPDASYSFRAAVGAQGRISESRFNWRARLITKILPYLADDLVLYRWGAGISGSADYVCENFKARIKPELLNRSVSVQLSGEYGFADRKIVLKAGCVFYSAANWQDRLYAYEAFVPGSYGGRLLYKKGFAGYGYLKAKPFKWCNLYFKYSAPDNFYIAGANIKI